MVKRLNIRLGVMVWEYGLIISDLIQVGGLADIGVNPLRVDEPRLVEHRFVERAVLKTAANKGCCTEYGLLQAASYKPGVNKDGGWKADEEVVLLLKPASMPPGAAHGDLAEAGTLELARGEGGEAEGTEFSLHCLKRAAGKMAFGEKGIPRLQTLPPAIAVVASVAKDVVNGKILETGVPRPEVTAAPFPQRKGLNRTADQALA